MEPFFPYIRYSNLPLNILNTLANEKLVPTKYLTEVGPPNDACKCTSVLTVNAL